MAQDFGDDVGEMLLRSISRYGEKAIGLILNEYFKSAVREWQQAKFEAEGMSKEEAAVKAEAMASREHICMPFGNATDGVSSVSRFIAEPDNLAFSALVAGNI